MKHDTVSKSDSPERRYALAYHITAATTAWMIWLFPLPELTGLVPHRGRVTSIFYTLPARPPAFYACSSILQHIPCSYGQSSHFLYLQGSLPASHHHPDWLAVEESNHSAQLFVYIVHDITISPKEDCTLVEEMLRVDISIVWDTQW